MRATSHKKTRTKRINLRATARQETLIRTGAATTGVSVTDFILDSACQEAERALADKRDFELSPAKWEALMEMLDRPARVIPELAALFANVSTTKSESSK